MAISLSDLKRVTTTLPPRVLIYGPPGIGKSTLAAEFPDPVFLQTEDGIPTDLMVTSFGLLSTYEEVMQGLGSLYSGEHQHRAVVADSLDQLEPMVWAHACQVKGWPSIEAPGYGKGYIEADSYWREFLDGLNALRRDRNMMIVLLAHSDVERFDDPVTVSYSRYDIRLHKRARAMIQDEMDAIFLINQDATIKTEDQGFGKKRAHADGGMQRWIYTEGRPSFNAKNRFGLPSKLLFTKGHGYLSFANQLPGIAAPQSEAKGKKKAAVA